MIGKMKMHEEYLPTTPIGMEARIIEEMAEATLEYAKCLRFGFHSRHPNGGNTNWENFVSEIKDVTDAIKRYEESI